MRYTNTNGSSPQQNGGQMFGAMSSPNIRAAMGGPAQLPSAAGPPPLDYAQIHRLLMAGAMPGGNMPTPPPEVPQPGAAPGDPTSNLYMRLRQMMGA